MHDPTKYDEKRCQVGANNDDEEEPVGIRLRGMNEVAEKARLYRGWD